MEWREHITVKPDVCHGKPCFKDTRIMVSVVLDCLADEMSIEEIVEDYPSLNRSMILAALAYSSELSQMKVIAA